MTIYNSRLEEIEEQDLLEWVKAKLLLMGFTDVDTIQVNL